MKKTKITCDYCGEDITDTGKYHLTLSSKLHLLDSDEIRTAIMRYPVIKDNHHFCHFRCLQDWVATK